MIVNEKDHALAQSLGQTARRTVTTGHVEIDYEALPHMCHAGGVVQGGYICAWIDSAMAYAAMSLDPDVLPLSLELKVSFLGPARPGPVVVSAWIEQRGRTVCFAEGKLSDPSGVVLAKGTSTLRLMPRDRGTAARAPAPE
jgi:uncharacterized protein (TIGR00369 family)